MTTDFAGATDEPFAVALQGDGNIVVAGLAENNAGSDFALARYIGGAGTSGGAGNGGGTGTSAATATTLGSSINPSSVGASIVFTATTSGTGPTGTVNFRDGLNSIPGCSAVALSGSGNARVASCTTASLGAGAHSVTAAYSGDATNAASTSAALTQTVNKVASATGIATSLTPTLAGSSVTFTATVSGSAPTGGRFQGWQHVDRGCSAVGLTGSGNVRTAPAQPRVRRHAQHHGGLQRRCEQQRLDQRGVVAGGEHGATTPSLVARANRAIGTGTRWQPPRPFISAVDANSTGRAIVYCPPYDANYPDFSNCSISDSTISGNTANTSCAGDPRLRDSLQIQY